MDDNENRAADPLSRTFAGMLGDLEDEALRLAARQSELARELADVEADLARIDNVRAAMTGKPKPGKRPVLDGPRKRQQRTRALDRAQQIVAWAGERGGTFTATDVAEFLEMKPQGIGPVLAGMVRRAEATVDDSTGERVYTLT